MNENKLLDAYKKQYGENATFEDGETQVFLFEDATVILTLEDGCLNATLTQDKPIKCDGTFFE